MRGFIQEIALHLAGYSSPDRSFPGEIRVRVEDGYLLVVIVRSDIGDDDSVAGEEVRADFTLRDGLWNLEWAGGRWRCARGYGHLGWTTSPCS